MPESITSNWQPIPILTYHQIAPTPPKGTPFRSLCVSPKNFILQMRLLSILGYRGLSMGELLPYLYGKKKGKVVGITFDDGYFNNLEYALPILKEHEFSATCYVVSSLLGKTNLWDIDKGIPQVPLMNSDQLCQWIDGGQEVGAHSRTHACLPELTENECQDEILGCKQDLERLLGVSVQHFCYPYGAFDESHARLVAEAGFLTATTTQRGRVAAGRDMRKLERVSVVRRTTRLGLLLKIATRYESSR
ncbi:MAG: polysaccharide deacetylase family protein [Microcystis aeruginosa Ma_MB_F_20061100_S20]|nr:MAG: polysaccharide deacetylase family protein [Microcystis aeruginosa Ma_MB_F_20061100_S20]